MCRGGGMTLDRTNLGVVIRMSSVKATLMDEPALVRGSLIIDTLISLFYRSLRN